jgi:hypothetical protein
LHRGRDHETPPGPHLAARGDHDLARQLGGEQAVRDHARQGVEVRCQCAGIVRRPVPVGDHAPVGARRARPHGGVPQRRERRRQPEGQQLERDRRADAIDELVPRGDHDEAIRRGGDELLARVRAAAALDDPAVGRDLVCSVDRDVEPLERLTGLDAQAERRRRRRGRRRRRDARHVEPPGGERGQQVRDGRARAEPHAHPVPHQVRRVPRGERLVALGAHAITARRRGTAGPAVAPARAGGSP